jgi:hypothetical protein
MLGAITTAVFVIAVIVAAAVAHVSGYTCYLWG